MYVCIINQEGEKIVHKNILTRPESLLKLLAPYREDIAIAVECMFCWYWIADMCCKEKIPFVLGHALYMKAIHGGKTKNDKIDSYKIAVLLKGGNLPCAYVYPQKMRSTRDLLRRRMFFMRKRAELLTHIQMTNTQYNLPSFEKKIAYEKNRIDIRERFLDKSVNKTIAADLEMLEAYDNTINELELYIIRHVKANDPQTLYLLNTIPGVGKILSLVLLYEIHDINRFERVQDFCSYARLIRPQKESAGKKYGASNKKIGNAHLKWAFSEAACIFTRDGRGAKKYKEKLENKYGKAKAMSILSHKLGRAVFYMLKHRKAFDPDKFLSQ